MWILLFIYLAGSAIVINYYNSKYRESTVGALLLLGICYPIIWVCAQLDEIIYKEDL